MKNERRKFLRNITTISALVGLAPVVPVFAKRKQGLTANAENRFKISLNAYSFNALLTTGKTTLEDLIGFCAKEGFDAIDMTGYYFKGYPAIPSDEYIYQLKRKAHALGVEISGTGVRNEFADPDKGKRDSEIAFVKKWIEVAAKLGAPLIRVFSGKTLPVGYTWEQVEEWVVAAFKECAEYGRLHGVIVAVQNHNDLIKTADQAIGIIEKVNSEWFGLVLDTGSFVTLEPYSEMRKTTGYAVNWQVKEKLNYNGKTEDMDLEKLMRIANGSTYRGYLPIETLSPGDPFLIVPPFLRKVKAALAKAIAS